MPDEIIPGAPHFVVSFDEKGRRADAAAVKAFLDRTSAGCTDVLVFSHGWNNDAAEAARLYEGFFGQVAEAVKGRQLAGVKLATAGVFWPSKMWADEAPPVRAGGAASVGGAKAKKKKDGELVRELKSVFPKAKAAVLEEMAKLLDEKARDQKKLERFHALMLGLDAKGPGKAGAEDDGEAGMLREKPLAAFRRFGALAPQQFTGGAAGLGDVFGGLWNGAKQALRMFTFWQMKKRAGVVGETGLGGVLADATKLARTPRFHLVGHSFGARLVSFSLRGVPTAGSPVGSVMLVQGAFSHFAFAGSLPHAPARAGALAGLGARVGGPVFVTHSKFDTAVGTAYPLACMASRDDAAALSDEMFRFGAMGHDGAQAVGAKIERIGSVGAKYPVTPGGFVNLNSDAVIKDGGPPSGAHGDIVHVEIAWALAVAARIVKS